MGYVSVMKYYEGGFTNQRLLGKSANLDKMGIPSGDFSKAVNKGHRFFIFAPNQGTMDNLTDAIIWAEKSDVNKDSFSVVALNLMQDNNHLMASFESAVDAQKFREHHDHLENFEIMPLINN